MATFLGPRMLYLNPNYLLKMANFLSRLFKGGSDSVLGIDIGSSAIKVVQLRRQGGRAVLETYGALSLGPYAKIEIGRATSLPVEKIVLALTDILREAKTTTKAGGVAIPFSASLMTIIDLPNVGEKQLAQMVPIEARKYIPVPIAEVSLDWSIIPRDQIGKTEGGEGAGEDLVAVQGKKVPKADILLVAIHNQTLRDHEAIVQKAGLEVSFFEIEIFSSMRSALDENDNKPAMILDLGAGSTKLYIVERGLVRTSHTVNRGSQDITSSIATSLNIPVDQAEIMKRTIGWNADPANKNLAEVIALNLDFIFSEARHVLVNYQSKYKKDVEKVVLTGGGATMKGFGELAQKNLETPAVLGDPFSKVQAPAFLNDILRKNGPEFSVALGLALRKLQENK